MAINLHAGISYIEKLKRRSSVCDREFEHLMHLSGGLRSFMARLKIDMLIDRFASSETGEL